QSICDISILSLRDALPILLEDQGLRVAIISLDDVYLTHDARQHLAATVHPLLQTRGVPGTHDVDLGVDTMTRLIHAGAGDRTPLDRKCTRLNSRHVKISYA